MKILFQGDSITDGGRGRDDDPNHIMGHSYAYMVAASLGYRYPEKGYEFINKGISGNTAADLYARWQNDAFNLEPDMISILIGTNDAAQEARSPAHLVCHRYEATLSLILRQTREVLPRTKMILMEPFMLDCGNIERDLFARRIELLQEKQQVVKRLASEFGAVFVPLQIRFNEAILKKPASYWIWDSIHPTYAGHALIAEAWLSEWKVN